MTRWSRRSSSPTPADTEEVQAALRRAQAQLVDAAAARDQTVGRWPRVREIIAAANEIREHNHLADIVRTALGETRS